MDRPGGEPSAPPIVIAEEPAGPETAAPEINTETPPPKTPEPKPTPEEAPLSEPPVPSPEPSAAAASEPAPPELTPETPPSPGMDVSRVLPLPENPTNPYSLNYGSPYLADGSLSDKKMAWYFGRNDKFQPPTAQAEFDIRPLGGHYLGDTSRRVVYLTFDEGYENGFTPAILDTLKAYGVKAAFFVTRPFVASNPELVTRMINEGHIVANHSVKHLSQPGLSDEDAAAEITGLAEYFESITGRAIAPYFRPPMGEYSARTLKIADDLGYKSVFWSLAFVDWDTENQPGMEGSFNSVTNYVHNGALILLHAVSESNTLALPYIIETLQNNGFAFETLDDLP